jgi:RNA polymerase sigma factor for flagellar operon FliA
MKVFSLFLLMALFFVPSSWAVSSNCARVVGQVQVLGQVKEKRIQNEEALRLYHVYKKAKDKTEANAARNALIEYLYPLARSIAYQYANARTLKNSDDLVQDAAIGIIGGIETFDPNQGEIVSYIARRALGQMIDAQRQNDWVPRRVRQASRQLEQLKQAYLTTYGTAESTAPSFEDFVRQKIPDSNEATQLLKDGRRYHMMRPWSSIEGQRGSFQSDRDPRDALSDQSSESESPPELRANREDVWNSLSRSLNERDRVIFDLYFRHDQPMKVIAQQLGISETRISQRMKNIIQLMKLKFHDFPHYREDLLEIEAQGH